MHTGQALSGIDRGHNARAVDCLTAILRHAPTAIFVVDQAGTIVLANAEVERLFNYSSEELHGQQLEVLLPERFRGQCAQYRSEFFSHPEARRMGNRRELFGM